jgi:hypothetical protein
MLEKPTVIVEHPDIPGESMIINKSDFNPEIHKLFKPKKQEAAKAETDAGGELSDESPESTTKPATTRGRKKPAAAE